MYLPYASAATSKLTARSLRLDRHGGCRARPVEEPAHRRQRQVDATVRAVRLVAGRAVRHGLPARVVEAEVTVERHPVLDEVAVADADQIAIRLLVLDVPGAERSAVADVLGAGRDERGID